MLRESRGRETDFDASLLVCYLETILFDVGVDLFDAVDGYRMYTSRSRFVCCALFVGEVEFLLHGRHHCPREDFGVASF